MAIPTNGYVDYPLTANKIRNLIEHLSQVAEKLETDELIHVAGSISIEVPSVPKALHLFEGKIKPERITKIRLLSDAEFMVKE